MKRQSQINRTALFLALPITLVIVELTLSVGF
jgi:hypothetical protein